MDGMWTIGSGVRFMRLLNFSIYLVGPILFICFMAIQFYQLDQQFPRPWKFALGTGLVTLALHISYHFMSTYWVMIVVTVRNYFLCAFAGAICGYLVYGFKRLTKRRH